MKRGVHLASKVLSLNTHFVKFTDGIVVHKFVARPKKDASECWIRREGWLQVEPHS